MAHRKHFPILPPIDFHTAKRYYFIYNNAAYNVAQVSTAIFKAAVLEKSPYWKQCVTYSQVLKQTEIDYPTRWWLLCSLADIRRGMVLYQSRVADEQVCREQVAG